MIILLSDYYRDEIALYLYLVLIESAFFYIRLILIFNMDIYSIMDIYDIVFSFFMFGSIVPIINYSTNLFTFKT